MILPTIVKLPMIAVKQGVSFDRQKDLGEVTSKPNGARRDQLP